MHIKLHKIKRENFLLQSSHRVSIKNSNKSPYKFTHFSQSKTNKRHIEFNMKKKHFFYWHEKSNSFQMLTKKLKLKFNNLLINHTFTLPNISVDSLVHETNTKTIQKKIYEKSLSFYMIRGTTSFPFCEHIFFFFWLSAKTYWICRHYIGITNKEI